MTDRAEVKYDFTPANPDPGDDYDKWRQNALNAMASGDDRGWSLADHVLGIDEGTGFLVVGRFPLTVRIVLASVLIEF